MQHKYKHRNNNLHIKALYKTQTVNQQAAIFTVTVDSFRSHVVSIWALTSRQQDNMDTGAPPGDAAFQPECAETVFR